MAYTISTHNGSAVSRQHNLRNPKVVSKQPHIEKDGTHETWIDKNPRQAYREIFGEAQAAYNKKQLDAGRPGRCIKSYYNEVAKDAKKHVAYEMIVTIGNRDNHPAPALAKEILRDFVDKWPERNGGLVLIGAYYHADEQGVAHVHVDYVPVARGYKNGLEVQNGLVKALNAIGFETRSSRDTAQIQWEHRENEYLEKLCRERGLEIEHPLEEGRKHLHTEIFKAEQMLKETKENVEAAQARCEYLAAKGQKMRQEGDKRFEAYKSTLAGQKAEIEANSAHLKALEEEIRYKENVYKIFGGDPANLPDRGGAAEPNVGEIDFEELIGK